MADKVYLIQEPFLSLQPSGRRVGHKALFLSTAAEGSKIFRRVEDLLSFAESQKPLDLVVILTTNATNRQTLSETVQAFIDAGYRVELEVLGLFTPLVDVAPLTYNVNVDANNTALDVVNGFRPLIEDDANEVIFKFYVNEPEDFLFIKRKWQDVLDIPDNLIYILPVVPEKADELKRAEIEAWCRERCRFFNYTLAFGRV